MKIVYRPKKFTPAHQAVIAHAEEICEDYYRRGLSLTLRQLYYQFVARGLLDNKQTEYKRLGEIINDARMAGEIDWEFLVDRTRNLVAPSTWRGPDSIVKRSAESYRTDLWKAQHVRVEVWIEKDAGIGVIERVCDDNSVPYFSCRGYTSQSEMWAAAQRLGNHLVRGNRVVVLHIGDHDPSGLDMTRDMRARLSTFLTNDWNRSPRFRALKAAMGGSVPGSVNEAIRADMRAAIGEKGGSLPDGAQPWVLRRIALTEPQIRLYDPPPNPAKQTDSRFLAYQQETGLDESWELDALDPDVLQNLIQDEIDALRDDDVWAESMATQDAEQITLQKIAAHWDEIAAMAEGWDAPAAEDED